MTENTLTSLYTQILRALHALDLERYSDIPATRHLIMMRAMMAFGLQLWAFDRHHDGLSYNDDPFPTHEPTILTLLDKLHEKGKTCRSMKDLNNRDQGSTSLTVTLVGDLRKGFSAILDIL